MESRRARLTGGLFCFTSRVDPQRRTALVSVVAAILLIALKLGAGLASHSLGLISEALHSGTDLVAALLTLFAVGVAVRPADVSHQYGHGKAEHLSALAEAAILVAASFFIAWRAISHLVGGRTPTVEARWYAFAVIGIVIVIDINRTVILWRASRRYRSALGGFHGVHYRHFSLQVEPFRRLRPDVLADELRKCVLDERVETGGKRALLLADILGVSATRKRLRYARQQLFHRERLREKTDGAAF